MSHEIRTPLNAIIGMTDLAFTTDLGDEQREYLSAIKESATSLSELISDILDFSKIEARKLDLDRTEFDLRNTVEDTLRVLAYRAQQKGIELACHIDPGVSDRLIGDPGRLRQILVNLLGNALKFTEKGEVVVRVHEEARTENRAHLQFSVADTGIGIAAELLQTVFEAFTQAHRFTAREYGGTGLGLAISYQLVEMMGGEIAVDSKSGQGTTVHFTARFELPETSKRTATAADLVVLKDMPVLVVDDNATSRQILEELLLQWRMRPSGAGGGGEAFEMMNKAANEGKPYRLLLVDTTMPDMVGLSLIERIRTDPRFKATALILMTPAGERVDRHRYTQLGITALVNKPVRRSDLMDAILTATVPSQARRAKRPPQPRLPLTKATHRLHVLLAEDNALNQKLVVRLLEKRGHQVTVTTNGRQALDALNRSASPPIDLLILDIEMPDIGGLEATAIIREREKGTEQHLPIVALTAHATKKDRERCLAAGMDAYISKPVTANDLFETIEGVVSGAAVTEFRPAEVASDHVIDEKALWERVDHDGKLLDTMAKLFLKDCPKKMAELKALLESGDTEGLAAAAHTLAGSVGNFAASAAVRAARKLEDVARGKDLEIARSAFDRLEAEMAALEQKLIRLRKANGERRS